MKPRLPFASGEYPEYNQRPEKVVHVERPERTLHCFEAKHYAKPYTNNEQDQLDALLEAGFAWEEAVTLLSLREHLYENSEIRQRMADDPRLNFVRWLYLNGEIDEGEQL